MNILRKLAFGRKSCNTFTICVRNICFVATEVKLAYMEETYLKYAYISCIQTEPDSKLWGIISPLYPSPGKVSPANRDWHAETKMY